MSGSIALQFDVFARLVATGNISACSDALNIPAVTVLEAMSSLEDSLGCQIFSMSGEGVALTEAGRRIVTALAGMRANNWKSGTDLLDDLASGSAKADEATETALPQAQRLQAIETVAYEPMLEEAPVKPKHFQPYRPEKKQPPTAGAPAVISAATQTITLASHPAIFSHFQEALLAFEEASPDIGITLMLESIDEDQAARLFYENKADIAYYYALSETHNFPSRYAWSERISLFVSADHPLAAEEALGAREIAALPYAALGQGNLSRVLAEQALAESGPLMPAPELETDDLYRLMRHVQQGTACFPAFGAMAKDFGRMKGIARLAYASGLPQIQVRQAIRPALAQDPAVQALAEFLFR